MTRGRVGPHALAALLAAVFALCALCIFPRSARAQAGQTEAKAWLDAPTAAVDEPFALHFQVMTTGSDTPSDPQPGPLPGLTVVGTSISPSTSISIVNGVVSQRRGVSVVWTLRGSRPGSFTLGPPSVALGGRRVRGDVQSIRLVSHPGAAGTARRPPGFGGVDPFDTWKGLFGDDPLKDLVQEQETEPNLALDAARSPGAFLHATVDKPRAVVGEQVTYTVYLYVDPSDRQGEVEDKREASAPDFLRRPIVEGGRGRSLGRARVGGRIWSVHLWRQTAYFPLKAGALEIGPFAADMVKGSRHEPKESERLVVQVSEAPAAGRPARYVSGDVGRFVLSAEVAPRETSRGGTVSVTVELRGEGNLPATLPMPEGAGIEWLEPQVREKVELVQNTRIGGRRTFTYVARLGREGDVELGSVELPFFNPDSRAYEIARAALGRVHVAPGAPVADAGAEEQDKLAGLPPPVTAREPIAAAPRHLSDAAPFWSALGLGPLAYLVARAGDRARTSLRARRDRARASPERDLQEKLKRADAARRAKDGAALAGAIEATLASACNLHLKVDIRGLAGGAVTDALLEAGLPADAGRELRAVLDACHEARFAPGGLAEGDGEDLFARATALTKIIGKSARSA